LESKGNHRAVTYALNLHVAKTAPAKGIGARDVGGRDLDIETIAAPVSFVIIQRLIGTERDPGTFRRIARMQGSDVWPVCRSVGIYLPEWFGDPALRRNYGGADHENYAVS
jgi:hypothetical protein